MLLFLIVISCHTEQDNNSNHGRLQTKQVKLGADEKLKAKARFDSLLSLAELLKWHGQKEKVSAYLNESLSITRQLNDDSMLAAVYLRLGNYFDAMTNYTMSVDYFYKALELFQKLKNKSGAAVSLNNMSWAYIQAFDYKKGIEQGFKGIAIAKQIPDIELKTRWTSYLANNLSIAYLEYGHPDSALLWNELANAEYKKLKLKRLNHYTWILSQFGYIYSNLKDYKKAEAYFNKALAFKDTSVTADAVVYSVGKYCHMLNKLERYNEVLRVGRDGIVIAQRSGGLRHLIDISDEMRIAFEHLHKIDSAYAYSKLATDLRDSIFNAKKSIQLQNISFNRDLKANELKYEIDKAKSEEKYKNEQRLRNIFLFALVFMVLFAGLFLYQRNKIKAGKVRSDELLLNILPEEVAEELKSKGIADAKQFDDVTVMFTDFKDFTQISESMTASELVAELNTFFRAFDEIITRYGIEKIKTIGDSYMCVGGLPSPSATHAEDVVNAGLAIQAFVAQHSEQRIAEGKLPLHIRIGIHSGPVVAGIVGIKKYAYDIWGDTVNTASRMESSGEAGKVNISESTYNLVKEKFRCLPRGKIHAKHKGDMEMYFVEGLIENQK